MKPRKELLAAISPHLTPLDSVTLVRPDLEITVALEQPSMKHGTSPRSEARPIGLKIKFGPHDFSWLNEKEMKLLGKLIATGVADNTHLPPSKR